MLDIPVTATMTRWMTVSRYGQDCLFGYADHHPTTGGLSWMLSTPVVEFAGSTRARTASGRIYRLGQKITTRELDEEGQVVLRLMSAHEEYPGSDDDRAWVITQKMARHLKLPPPSRSDHSGVERFLTEHRDAYQQLREKWLDG